MTEHKVGTREEWVAARQQLLVREKELTHRGDELARQRRELPWVRVDKEYRFETEDGPKTLGQLFDGRSQLLVYHFMFGEEYTAGCPVCSAGADTFNGAVPHLQARDVTFLCVSRAPLERLQAYKRRMGWTFPWVSSRKTDFNFDFDVSHTREQLATFLEGDLPPVVRQFAIASGTDPAGYLAEGPGLSAFVLSDGDVYHTYSTYARGLEIMLGFYPLLDRVPKGRNESDDQPFWVRRHDEYSRTSQDSRRAEKRVDFAEPRSTNP
ncbi:MAG TPA: DUF899 domain-containing protein [Gemmatimonadaceae bacterium]|nr:DUF899 domain-containing protein [Gemmatimonadaceae bacterium]